MEKKKVIKFLGFFVLLVVVFLPGYSKFQELDARNRALQEKIRKLEVLNGRLNAEIRKLEEDPSYVEKVARAKLKVSKKGEVIYKIVESANETVAR